MRNEAVFTVQRAAEAGFAPDCIDPQLHALELKCSPDLVIHLPHLFVKLHDPGGDHRQPDYDQHDAAKDGACGGSDDGGIDGMIHTTDDLGYRETILMQMKNRHAVMTAKDVREFYGAVCAENGSRGIFITLSSFHPEAQKLLDKVDNLTGVNGDKLFEIAKRCRLGLVEKDGRLCIDEELLLNT